MGIQAIVDQMYSEIGKLEYLIMKSSAQKRSKSEIRDNLDAMMEIVQNLKKELKY